jgi:hypothetical protein
MEPYRISADQALAALDTDDRLGLSENEARARLERHGRNELTAEKPVPAWKSIGGESEARRLTHAKRLPGHQEMAVGEPAAGVARRRSGVAGLDLRKERLRKPLERIRVEGHLVPGSRPSTDRSAGSFRPATEG